MAIKTYYFKDAVPSGATAHRSLQDGGTAPTTATTATGWIAGTNAIGQSCLQQGGSEVSRTDGSWGTTLQPSAAPSQTTGDCWRSENTIAGTFANASWTFTFGIRSVTAALTGRVKLAVRVWRSSNANGTSATQLTSARQASAATSANLSTTVDTNVTVTWSPGTTIVLTGEYLFVNVGVEITAAGGGNTQDIDFRVGSGFTLATPDFTLTTIQIATGLEAISAQTAPGSGHSQALTGQAAASAGGTLTAATGGAGTADARVSWAEVEFPYGPPPSGTSAALTGQQATAAQGTLTPGVSFVAVLVGQQVTSVAGTLTQRSSVGLVGHSATVGQGVPTAATAGGVTLVGQQATAATGSLTAARSFTLTGQQATSAGGTLGVGGSAVTLTGQQVTSAAGTVTRALPGAVLVAHTTVTGGGPSPAIDTTGATLITVIANYDRSEATPTISDSKANTPWLGATAQLEAAFPAQRIYYVEHPITGSGHTFTVSIAGGAGTQSAIIQAWSGTVNSGAFDQQNGGTNSASESIAVGSVTPGADNEFLIAGWSSNTARTPAIGSGFSLGDNITTAGFYAGASAWVQQGVASAVNPTWTWTGQGNARSAVTIASFKTILTVAGLGATAIPGTLVASRSVTLTGQAAATAQGTITSSGVTPIVARVSWAEIELPQGIPPTSGALTGQSVTAGRGTLTAPHTANLTGQQGTAALGSMAASTAGGATLIGQQVTSASGTLAPRFLISPTFFVSIGAQSLAGILTASGQSPALTGLQTTTAVGALFPAIRPVLTGQQASVTVGALSGPASNALTGQQAISSIGTLTPGRGAASVPGLGATVEQGTLAADHAQPLTGHQVTAAQGALATNGALSGLQATASAGTLAPATGNTSTLTGHQVIATQGSFTLVSHTNSLTGEQAAIEQGTVTPAIGNSAALTGQGLTTAQGSLSVAHTNALTGQAVATAQGSLSTATGGLTLTGQQVSATANALTVPHGVALIGQQGTTAQSTPDTLHINSITGQAVTATGGILIGAAASAVFARVSWAEVEFPRTAFVFLGREATAVQGTLGVRIQIPIEVGVTDLIGLQATAQRGTLTPVQTKAMVGFGVTTSAGAIGSTHSNALGSLGSGFEAIATQGTLTYRASSNFLPGIAATSQLGALGILHSNALTGQAGTAERGTLVTGQTYSTALTGQGATSAQGTPTTTHSQALTGSSATVSQGVLSPAKSGAATATGQQANAQQGSLTSAQTNVVISTNGLQVTASAGTLSVAQSFTAALTGLDVSTLRGNVGPILHSNTLSSATATAQVGNITGAKDGHDEITGLGVTCQQGTLTPTQNNAVVTLSGLQATSAKGTLGVHIQIPIEQGQVDLVGLQAIARMGILSPTAPAGPQGLPGIGKYEDDECAHDWANKRVRRLLNDICDPAMENDQS